MASEVFGLREGNHFKHYRSFPRVIDFNPMDLNHLLSFVSADNPEHGAGRAASRLRRVTEQATCTY